MVCSRRCFSSTWCLRDKTPEAILTQAEAELGTHFFERRKIAGAKQGDELAAALAARFGTIGKGDTLTMGGRARRVARVVTLDGFKVVFDDGAWFGVRASGTEPVCRPYVEVIAPPGAPAAQIDACKRDHAAIMDWLSAEIRLATA
jgi:phosphomannomutase